MNILNDISKISKQLMINEPFYGVFLSTLNKQINQNIPTAGVSKNNINYILDINEDFWNSLNEDRKKIGLLKHELLHICFHHLINRENYSDHKLYNIAADIEINQYIEPDYYPTPDLLLPNSFPELNLPKKAGTREYYNLLQQAKEKNTSPALNNLLDNNLHSTWDSFNNISEAEKRLCKAQIDHQIKTIIEEQSKSNNGRGFIPYELQEYINSLFEAKPPSYDWKSYFRRFFGSSNKIYTKKTRRKLNKRFSENPALKIKPKKNVLVGIDTSGSVGKKDLIEFFNEIQHMYKTGIAITVAEGDAEIHNVYEYNSKMPEFVKGRGGTDMNPFIDYFNKNKQYNSLIILTDGFIGERTVSTFKPMLVVLCSNGEDLTTVKNNGWGNVIKII